MRATLILVVFFAMFTAACLLIPSPMFPGNSFCSLVGQGTSEYYLYIGAVFNGVFYGVIIWIVFALISKRIEGEK